MERSETVAEAIERLEAQQKVAILSLDIVEAKKCSQALKVLYRRKDKTAFVKSYVGRR